MYKMRYLPVAAGLLAVALATAASAVEASHCGLSYVESLSKAITLSFLASLSWRSTGPQISSRRSFATGFVASTLPR